MDLKKDSTLTLAWLDQRFSNVFERVPNLSLVNKSRPKPQTTYEKMDCLDEFWQQVAKLLISAIYSFLKCPRCRQTISGNVQNAVNTKRGFGLPLRDPFFDPSPHVFVF